MTRVVLDTNVLVSALWNPDGAPARVVALLYSGSCEPVVSADILREYQRVLRHPRLGLPGDDVAVMLAWFARFTLPVPPPGSPVRCAHADDEKFVAAGLAANAAYLVTGNRRHFPEHVPDLAVVSPTEFLDAARGSD